MISGIRAALHVVMLGGYMCVFRCISMYEAPRAVLERMRELHMGYVGLECSPAPLKACRWETIGYERL